MNNKWLAIEQSLGMGKDEGLRLPPPYFLLACCAKLSVVKYGRQVAQLIRATTAQAGSWYTLPT